MPQHHILAYIFSAIAFISSAILYRTYIWSLGFPDGFVTELGRAERVLFWWFIAESVLLGIAFLVLAFSSAPRKNVYALLLIYAVSALAVVAIDAYLRSHLMGGGGG